LKGSIRTMNRPSDNAVASTTCPADAPHGGGQCDPRRFGHAVELQERPCWLRPAAQRPSTRPDAIIKAVKPYGFSIAQNRLRARRNKKASMIKITEAIRSLLNDNPGPGPICVIGTAAMYDGYPQLSPRGSLIAYNDDCLAFWERVARSTARLIRENPRVTVYYRNKERGSDLFPAGVLRFYGDVEFLPDGPDRDRIYNMIPEHERNQDLGKTGKAILVHLQRIEDLNGKVLMRRE
jgi:hypothetical protein